MPPYYTTPICLFLITLQPFKGHKIHLHHSHSFTPPKIIYSPFLEHKIPLICSILTLSYSTTSCLLYPTSMENFLAYSSTLIEAADSSEMSVHIYQTRRCCSPQNNEHHSHHSGNKFKIIIE